MKGEALALLAIAGAGVVWYLSRGAAPTMDGRTAELRRQIGALPGELNWREKQAAQKAADRADTLSSTASYASMGAVAGPWGAAAGAGFGFFKSIF